MFLKILFIALIGVIILPLVLKEPPKKYVTEALTIFALYQLVFITFHPLLGLLSSLFCAIAALISYVTMKNDNNLPLHVSVLYCSAFLASLGLFTEFVETFAGRLF